MATDSSSLVPDLADQPQAGLTGIPLLILSVVLTALAAGTGWGIRGQYGHETGAMIAGTLASLTLVLLFVPRSRSLNGIRAAAMMAIAIGVGGSMTYGQTVGLTHDQDVVGNFDAWKWGMLGLALKGGVWIGFGGLFLGMGLGGKRYHPFEIALMLLVGVGLWYVGIRLLHTPFDPDPAAKSLPWFYFSDHWQFEPERWDKGLMKPRFECFGGYWLALIGMTLYARVIRGDRLALRMACFGIIGGALGFPGGQCIQSAHSWHPEWFKEGGQLGFGHKLFRTFNWWNVMETTFGTIWGAVVGFGLWLNRRLIDVTHSEDRVSLAPPVEIVFAVLYVTFVLIGEFEYLHSDNLVWASNWYIEIGLLIVSLPLIGISGGRLSPYLALFVLIPVTICGKTLRAVGWSTDIGSVWFQNTGYAWYMLVQVPLAIGLILASWLIHKATSQTTARAAAVSLTFTALLYFGLNSVFFGFPDLMAPLENWGGRHATHAYFMVTTVCLLLLSAATALIFPGCFVCRKSSDAASATE